MIYKNDLGAFVISSQQVWLPGVYESERAAKYAFHFPDEDLSTLQGQANERGGGVIAFADLQSYRRRKAGTP